MKLSIDVDTVTLEANETLDIHFGSPEWRDILRIHGDGTVELIPSSSNFPLISVNMRQLERYIGMQK